MRWHDDEAMQVAAKRGSTVLVAVDRLMTTHADLRRLTPTHADSRRLTPTHAGPQEAVQADATDTARSGRRVAAGARFGHARRNRRRRTQLWRLAQRLPPATASAGARRAAGGDGPLGPPRNRHRGRLDTNADRLGRQRDQAAFEEVPCGRPPTDDAVIRIVYGRLGPVIAEAIGPIGPIGGIGQLDGFGRDRASRRLAAAAAMNRRRRVRRVVTEHDTRLRSVFVRPAAMAGPGRFEQCMQPAASRKESERNEHRGDWREASDATIVVRSLGTVNTSPADCTGSSHWERGVSRRHDGRKARAYGRRTRSLCKTSATVSTSPAPSATAASVRSSIAA